MHNRLPAHRRHDERREQGGYRRADIARAKDPKSRASPLRRVEAREVGDARSRSEEHTSELQSLMRSSYAVLCLKKTNKQEHITRTALYELYRIISPYKGDHTRLYKNNRTIVDD